MYEISDRPYLDEWYSHYHFTWTVQGENAGYVCNKCFLSVERNGKIGEARPEHSYCSKQRRGIMASPLARSRKRRSQKMTASMVSKSAYTSKYKLCFRQLLAMGKSAERAFATIVHERAQREMSAFIRSSSDQYPTLMDTKSIASFSWSELMNNLQNWLPVLYAAVSGAMPNRKGQST